MLTSYDDADLAAAGYDFTVPELVAERAAQARDIGVDGLVCSAEEAREPARDRRAGMVLVTPGIRPAGADAGDQKRIMTPAAAIAAGADYLVVGRPIVAAADPKAAADAIVAEIAAALRQSAWRRPAAAFLRSGAPLYPAAIWRRPMSDMRLIVAGAGGRMGRTLIQAIAATDGVTLAGAVEAPGSAVIGRDAGELAGLGANGITVATDAAPLIGKADGLIDFTIPAATLTVRRADGAHGLRPHHRHHRAHRRGREADRRGGQARRDRQVRQL